MAFMKVDERKEIERLLVNGIGPSHNISLRTITQRDTYINEWVNVDDLIQLLTDLVETTMDDNKQEAFKGLRLLLRSLKRNEVR